MTISELIEQLEKMEREVGDIEVESDRAVSITKVDCVWDDDEGNIVAIVVK